MPQLEQHAAGQKQYVPCASLHWEAMHASIQVQLLMHA